MQLENVICKLQLIYFTLYSLQNKIFNCYLHLQFTSVINILQFFDIYILYLLLHFTI